MLTTLTDTQYDYHPGIFQDIGTTTVVDWSSHRWGTNHAGGDNYFPSQPPNDDDDITYRYNGTNAMASQCSVR